jgi:hypothetical protein
VVVGYLLQISEFAEVVLVQVEGLELSEFAEVIVESFKVVVREIDPLQTR